MSTHHDNSNARVAQGRFYYGWIIVAACTVVLAMQAGTMYSFGIFFKPLAGDFGWSRAATSGVYSLNMISLGVFAIPMGLLADRFGPAKVVAFCGFVTGLGLILTSQVSALWQFYVTYGLIVGTGLSGGFGVGVATTARWFVKRRGLALGIVSAGVGLGTLTMSPIAERLIAAFDWSGAYFIVGLAAWVAMIGSALFLRRHPGEGADRPSGAAEPLPQGNTGLEEGTRHSTLETGITLWPAFRTKPLWTLILIFFLFNFCVQMIMVHLVNYATDSGISAPIAATLISVIGIGSITGRLAMGTLSDRIGSNNALIICCIVLATTLPWLIFATELWMFYLFAIIFGFAYGGEVPQMPALIGQFFGLRAVAALVGAVLLGTTMGGALGSWVGGRVFDVTDSYQVAFRIVAIVSLSAVIITLILKKQGKKHVFYD